MSVGGKLMSVVKNTYDKTNYYMVFQNGTHKIEISGKYLWSPKLNKVGNKNLGYENMSKVKKGDIILHSFQAGVQAISVAINDVYDSSSPNNKIYKDSWMTDGYRVDCHTILLEKPIYFKEHQNYLSEQSDEVSAFTVKGTGKLTYLSVLSDRHYNFFINEIEKNQIISLDDLDKKYFINKTKKIRESKLLEIDDLDKYSELFAKVGGNKSLGRLNQTKKKNHLYQYKESTEKMKFKIGKLGEFLALKELNEMYRDKNKYLIKSVSTNLNSNLEQANDGAGYDILVENLIDHRKYYYEVKTTVQGNVPFDISANELSVMKDLVESESSDYYIFRIYDLDEKKLTYEISIMTITNDFRSKYIFEPTSYKFGSKN